MMGAVGHCEQSLQIVSFLLKTKSALGKWNAQNSSKKKLEKKKHTHNNFYKSGLKERTGSTDVICYVAQATFKYLRGK